MSIKLNLIGQTFGKLTVLQRTKRTLQGQWFWLCQCECGNIKEIRQSSFKHGSTVSCGCYRKSIYHNKLSGNSAAFNSLYLSLKNRAKKKELIFNISKKIFKSLSSKNCYYCNTVPIQEMKTYKNTPSYFYNGLDRIDNSKGYTVDNVLTACGRCNKLRGTELTVEETLLVVSTLLKFRAQNENNRRTS